MSKTFDATLRPMIGGHASEWGAFLAARIGLRGVRGAASLDSDLSSTLQADQLLRLDGRRALLHLELEAASRRQRPARLFRYNAAAHGATDRPVESVLVLLRRSADSRDLTGLYEVRSRAGAAPIHAFRYHVWRVWETPAADLIAAGPGLAPLATLTDESAGDLGGVLGRMASTLQSAELPAIVKDDLFHAAFVVGTMRHDSLALALRFRDMALDLTKSPGYKYILRKGHADGRAQGLVIGHAEGRAAGRAEGRAAGRAEGRAEGAAEIIRAMAVQRFGESPEAEAALAALDAHRLRRVADRLLTAADWADLLATP